MFWQERLNPRIVHNDNLAVVNFTLHSCDGTSFQYFHTFFPTNNSVGNTRLFWNQLLFSVENKHLFAFLSRRLALNLLMVFKVFLQSASGPSFLCLQLDPQKWSTLRATPKTCSFGLLLQPLWYSKFSLQIHMHSDAMTSWQSWADAKMSLWRPYSDFLILSLVASTSHSCNKQPREQTFRIKFSVKHWCQRKKYPCFHFFSEAL